MKYLVLDDEKIAADYLASLICEIDKNAEIFSENNPKRAMKIAESENLSVCFIDIQMPGINGIEFAETLKKINPRINFIFVTGYSEYMGDAFRLDASDYLMKPANREQVAHALENLRYTNSEQNEINKRIQIKCFGNFEIFVDDKPVRFKFDKTKELLAYLVYRKGARCTSKEVMAMLWEDDGHDSYYRMLKKDLLDVMNKLGCEKIILSTRGQISLMNLQCIECDYFKWADEPETYKKLYHGEFMAQYSWAEEVNGTILTLY